MSSIFPCLADTTLLHFGVWFSVPIEIRYSSFLASVETLLKSSSCFRLSDRTNLAIGKRNRKVGPERRGETGGRRDQPRPGQLRELLVVTMRKTTKKMSTRFANFDMTCFLLSAYGPESNSCGKELEATSIEPISSRKKATEVTPLQPTHHHYCF